MTVQRFIALGEPKNAPVRLINDVPPPRLRVEAANVSSVLAKYGLLNNTKILALCPGAEFGASKQWPASHYASLARHYVDKGWQVWLMGSQKDLDVCHEINESTDSRCVILAGKTTLPEAVDVLSAVDLVVSNDSGLMHIAAALNVPLAAIYGSTDPGHTPPLSANHVIARLGLECSPCFKRECPLQHQNCLQQLSPQLVIELTESLTD